MELCLYIIIYIAFTFIYTSRNPRHRPGSVKAFENCTLIYESYFFNVIKCFGVEYLPAITARLQPKNHTVIYYTIKFNAHLS